MKLKDIKPGRYYETELGVGRCVVADSTVVQIDITHPFPRGRINLRPRDVLRAVVPEPEQV